MLIYEGHNIPNQNGGPDPQTTDQPTKKSWRGTTQNGLFEKRFLDSSKNGEPWSLLSMKRFIERLGHSTDSSSLRMCGNIRTARGKFLNSNSNWLIRVVRLTLQLRLISKRGLPHG